MTPEREYQWYWPSQREQSRSADSSCIPSGAKIPLEILKHIPLNSLVLDMGGGVGTEALLLKKLGIDVALCDINPSAVKKASAQGILALVVDVTDSREIGKIQESLHDQQPDAIIMEALLCNLTGVRNEDQKSWQSAIDVAFALLRPGGYVYIAEVLRVDENHSEICSLIRKELTESEEKEWIESWKKRYAANKDLGLPEGTIVVAKKPKDSEDGSTAHGELGSSEDLQALLHSENFERFAYHFCEKELLEVLEEKGFNIENKQYAVWQSRQKRPLPGIVIIAQKPETALQDLS